MGSDRGDRWGRSTSSETSSPTRARSKVQCRFVLSIAHFVINEESVAAESASFDDIDLFTTTSSSIIPVLNMSQPALNLNATHVRKVRQADVHPNSTTSLVAAASSVQFNENDLRTFTTWPEYTYFSGFIQFNDTT